MERCYYSQKNTVLRYTLLLLAVIESVVLIALGIVFWRNALNTIVLCCVLIVLGLLVLIYGVFHFLILNRGYEINVHGIWVQYTQKIRTFYPWNDIAQICICEVHRSANGATKDVVIWCTLGSIVNGPPDPGRCWNSSEYELSHFRTVLIVEYSPERLSEFERLFNGDIADYR